jgi:phage terminase small subunit
MEEEGGVVLDSSSELIRTVPVWFRAICQWETFLTTRKSSESKHLAGTARSDRFPKPTAIDRLMVVPPPPDQLSERAQSEWAWLAHAAVRLGILCASDLRSLQLLASVLATETELAETLAREGYRIGARSHPAFRQLESTRALAMRLLTSFGLTPVARQGVDVQPIASRSIGKLGPVNT